MGTFIIQTLKFVIVIATMSTLMQSFRFKSRKVFCWYIGNVRSLFNERSEMYLLLTQVLHTNELNCSTQSSGAFFECVQQLDNFNRKPPT